MNVTFIKASRPREKRERRMCNEQNLIWANQCLEDEEEEEDRKKRERETEAKGACDRVARGSEANDASAAFSLVTCAPYLQWLAFALSTVFCPSIHLHKKVKEKQVKEKTKLVFIDCGLSSTLLPSLPVLPKENSTECSSSSSKAQAQPVGREG